LASIGVTETKMAEEDRVGLRNGVNVATDDGSRPEGSTDKHAVWSASGPGRLQVVGVKGAVSFGCEDQGALCGGDEEVYVAHA
jgi:hypothetical protein